MAVMQYSIKTGHTCFNQQFCNTVITLDSKEQFYTLIITWWQLTLLTLNDLWKLFQVHY